MVQTCDVEILYYYYYIERITPRTYSIYA